MSLPIFNQPYAINFHPTDFCGFKTTPRAILGLRFYIPIHSLGITLETFHFPKTMQVL